MKSDNNTDVSIIIISYNTKDLIEKCIKSIVKHTKKIRYEIIVVDNGSTDGSVDFLKKLSNKSTNIQLIESNKNIGFGPANNLGIEIASGRYILFLNSDTIIHDNLICEMYEWMNKNKQYGISSCALKNTDGSYQGSGGYFPNLINVFSWMTIQDLPFVDKLIKPFHPMKERSIFKNEDFYKQIHELDWVTGAFMYCRSEIFNEIIGFDEDYFMYTEEVDLCYRAKRAGWKVVYQPKWYITHLGGGSSTKEFAVLAEFEGVKTFFRKHYPRWQMPLLRFFLKVGSLLRIFVFGKTYAKAFFKV